MYLSNFKPRCVVHAAGDGGGWQLAPQPRVARQEPGLAGGVDRGAERAALGVLEDDVQQRALVEGVERVRDGTAEKIAQNPDEGTYEGWCRKEDVEVDWTQPVDTVYNLIRGANPQPGAWTTYDNRELGILDCRKVDAGGAPGEVVAVQSDSLVVATASGGLQIDRLRAPDLGKIGAGEFATRTELAPGCVFGRQVK